MMENLDIVIRLVASCLMGGVVGYERSARKKSAGLRTHILVCLGSCLIMILSINIYRSVQGLTNADPTRLAAQVVSGIGFLGAGTIMKEGVSIHGLTTAASLWMVAAIGLAVGSGHFFASVLCTALGFFTLTTLAIFEHKHFSSDMLTLEIITSDRPGQIGRIGSCLGNLNISIQDIRIEDREGEMLTLIVVLKLQKQMNTRTLIEKVSMVEDVVSVNAVH